MKQGIVLWFTGLSGAGKSTLAIGLKKNKFPQKVYNLDGDVLRGGLNSDLGFSKEDRLENIRRNSHVARLLADEGYIVICSFISPYIEHRQLASNIIGKKYWNEVYIKCSIWECEKRDVKGLYKKVRQGLITNFTGINDVYEAPESPDLICDTEYDTIKECLDKLYFYINKQ